MRKVSRFLKIKLLGLVLLAVAFFHPAFRLTKPPSLQELLAQPADLDDALALIGDYLNSDSGRRIRDNWGLQYPQSGKVLEDAFSSRRDPVADLNLGIAYLENGRYTKARTALGRHHNRYIPEVKKGPPDDNKLPKREQGRVLYGLYRYNRAVALTALAETNSGGSLRVAPLLRQALFDLRKTVYAFESLGAVRNNAGTYWGAGAAAWEGHALRPEHGGLAIHRVYANLAVVYLRLGSESGYPYQLNDYLRREQNKYSWGDNAQLSPVVNRLIGLCTSSKNRVPLKMFRLTQALHNLEAASRGIEGLGEERDIFYYTIGVLLNHLADFDEAGIDPSQAGDFFKIAVQASSPERPAYHLAQKELALILLKQERWQEAMALFGELDLGEVEAAIKGPGAPTARLFSDIGLVTHFSTGNLNRVYSHLERRQHEIRDEDLMAVHRELLTVLATDYYRSLKGRLKKYNAADRAGFLAQMDGDPGFAKFPFMATAFEKACRDPLLRQPAVAINYELRKNPSTATMIWIVIWLLFLGLCLYGAWVYTSHRKLARQILQSGYGDL